MKWFRFRDDTPASNDPAPANVISATPYHVKMEKSRTELHWLVKKHSNVISTKVYSEIRELERTLEEINAFIIDHKANAADEHMLDSIMKNYLPSAIELFVKLPEQGRNPDGDGEALLLKQCRTMARDLRKRNADLHYRAEAELRTQAAFIEERFNDSNAT